MPDPSYENVAPLLAGTQQSGRSARFVFKCPVTNATVQANYNFSQSPGTQSRVTAAAQRSFWYEVRREVGYAIRAAFGYNMLGRVAADMANAAMTAQQTGQSSAPRYTDEEMQVAAVEAFRGVQSQFAWDTKGNRWISKRALQDALSPFERQAAEFPVDNAYDRSILARMLVEVACADGSLHEAEESFLLEFMDQSEGSVEELAQRPELTDAELGETSAGGVRETLFMLACALAFADEEFSEPEKKKLDEFANGLALPGAKKADVLKKAQGFLLDQALEKMFTYGGHDQMARDELLKLADRIGMDRRAATVVEAQFQKRRGAAKR